MNRVSARVAEGTVIRKEWQIFLGIYVFRLAIQPTYSDWRYQDTRAGGSVLLRYRLKVLPCPC
jgi:hypothetical protein